MSDKTVSVRAPDLAQARAFLDSLDARPGASFGFRTIDDGGDDPRLAIKAFGNLGRGVRQSGDLGKNGRPCRPARLLAYMQGLGAGVFVMPNELDGRGQGKASVMGIRTLWIDADSSAAVAGLRAFIAQSGLVPAVVVASGGTHEGVDKLHAYWRVTACPVADFTHGQLTLVSRIGSDPAVQDAGRVMRLPGFWHQKREPRMTRIVESSNAHYAWPGFLAQIQLQPQLCDPWAGGKGTGTRRVVAGQSLNFAGPTARLRVLLNLHGGLVTPAVRTLLKEAVAPTMEQAGNRHATLMAVAARLVQIGWLEADIQALVQPVVIEHWGVDRRERLAGMLAWARGNEATARAAEPALSAHAARIVTAFSAARRAAE